MNSPWARRILRATAIAIAVAALADPVWSIERSTPIPLTLIKMTAADVTQIEAELRRINAAAALQVREVVDHRLPCAPGDRCVVIADGSVDAGLPADLDRPLSLIKLVDTAAANVRLRSVMFASGQQAGAAGVARVAVDGRGVIGRRTEIRIVDTGATVGSAIVEWKSEGTETIDVPWWPLAPGPRTLRVEALPTERESVIFDNVIAAGVDARSEPLPVLVFDARASWGSTFVRRALEDDAGFAVEHRARLAPAIAAGTPTARLDARALDASSVLIVGGPDALTASDVDLIERFVRIRGGSAILLPERAPTGSVKRLFAGEWSERLTSEPQAVEPLMASEALVLSGGSGPQTRPAAATAMSRESSPEPSRAEADASGAVVIAPTGAGRIVVATAMDAWRYRDDDGGAFDRFWRSVVAEAAAAGAPLRIEFDNAIAVPGSRQQFVVRHRSMTPPPAIEANAVMRCGPPLQFTAAPSPAAAAADRAETIRLWPAGAPGVLRGELPMAVDGACIVEVTVDGATVRRGLAVSNAPTRSAEEALAQLERYARGSGGVVTDKDNLDAVVVATPPVRATIPVQPMRSAWWLVQFAGCLSVEWWLRRRTGLR